MKADNIFKIFKKKIRLITRIKNIYNLITFDENEDIFKNHIQKTKDYWLKADFWHNEDGNSAHFIATNEYVEKFSVKYEDLIGKEIEKFVSNNDFYVLEIGCSKGQFLFYLNEKLVDYFKPAKIYFGNEINKETCNQAKERISQIGNNNFIFSSYSKIADIFKNLELNDKPIIIFTIRTLANLENNDYEEVIDYIDKIKNVLFISSEHAFISNKLVNHFGKSKSKVHINKKRPLKHRLTIIRKS